MFRVSAGSIKLTSVYGNPRQEHGVPTNPSSQPYAHLLEIDGIKILLDCGWNESFDPAYLERLRPVLPTVDAVLISTPELCSCGALPYVLEHIRPTAFVAAAVSTSKMAIHSLLHPFVYQYPNAHVFSVRNGSVSVNGEDEYDSFSLSVDKIYSSFRSVREPYGGDVVVKNDEVEVKCSSVFTGRMFGAHGWLVRYQIDELFYCPDLTVRPSYALKRFNIPTTSNILCIESFSFQPRLRHLAGLASTNATAAGAGGRGGASAATSAAAKYEEQLQLLFRDIQHTLRSGSDVLFPTTVSARGLDILCTLVHLLQEKGGDKYKVVLASLQAQELMDKASTMTEALQDEIMLGDRVLFSNVVACRTADEVLMITGPKVCVADGASLDYGIAAELLPHFLKANATQGGENLIVLTETPAAGTNAFEVAQTPQYETMTYSFAKRSRLTKEELEEYYVQQEREMELARQRLQEEGMFDVEKDAAMDSDSDDGEEDDADANEPTGLGAASEDEHKGGGKGGEGPGAVPGAAPSVRNTPGLVLPSHMQFTSKFLHFPVLDTSYTLSAASMKGDNVVYGLPVSDEEQLLLRKRAPNRSRTEDEGPDAITQLNDAQMEANIPSKVFTVTQAQERNCKVVWSDFSGYPDAPTLRGVLKSKFTFAKKVVSIRGGTDCWRLLAQFTRNEKSMKAGENVLMFRGPAVALELATQVLSYTVQLDPELAQQLPSSLKRVREVSSQSTWEVGWVNGELRGAFGSQQVPVNEIVRHTRLDESQETALALTALHGGKVQECASERERTRLQSGSFFVGNMELIRLRDSTRRHGGLYSEFHRKAPMLVYDEGVCVRKGASGTVTVASVASPSMFEVRQSVYKQFSQIL